MKRRPADSFAQIVADVNRQPPPPAPLNVDELRFNTLSDPAGTRYHRTKSQLAPSEARDLVRSGAPVAWDSCGCGGGCGLNWPDEEAVLRMVAAGVPVTGRGKRYFGSVSEWRSDDGRPLVVVEGNVRWGRELG